MGFVAQLTAQLYK